MRVPSRRPILHLALYLWTISTENCSNEKWNFRDDVGRFLVLHVNVSEGQKRDIIIQMCFWLRR